MNPIICRELRAASRKKSKTSFNGVATKYLNNYLAWFQVLESIQHQRNPITMNYLMIKGNLIQHVETFDTIRLSRFTI